MEQMMNSYEFYTQSPYDGYIQLNNQGVFVARLRLSYTKPRSKYRTSVSAKVLKGETKKLVLPEGSTNIFMYIEYANALGKWKELLSEAFHEPTIACYRSHGILLSPKCEEVECSSLDMENNLQKRCSCCCKCYCRCCCNKNK